MPARLLLQMAALGVVTAPKAALPKKPHLIFTMCALLRCALLRPVLLR